MLEKEREGLDDDKNTHSLSVCLPVQRRRSEQLLAQACPILYPGFAEYNFDGRLTVYIFPRLNKQTTCKISFEAGRKR